MIRLFYLALMVILWRQALNISIKAKETKSLSNSHGSTWLINCGGEF